MTEIVEIPIEKIQVGPHNVRLEEDDPELDDLAASIGRIGIIVPLSVVQDNDNYTLVAGHRRLAASLHLGRTSVPCIIMDNSKIIPSEASFAENLFRKDLSPIELAAAIKDTINQEILSVDKLSDCLHRSTEWIRRQIAILDWPADVTLAIHEGWLSVTAASNLALISDSHYREFLLGHARQSGATARLTAAWLQAWQAMQPPQSAVQQEPIPPTERATPMIPQAPCIVCSEVFRTDELSHVPCCARCIRVIREIHLTQQS